MNGKRFAHKVSRFMGLSQTDRWSFLLAFASLVKTDMRLLLFGFERTIKDVKGLNSQGQNVVRGNQLALAQEYASWVEIASRLYFARAKCLHQSLTLHHLLQREGFPSELRIGVRKADGRLLAHAWVELAGEVVNDRPDAVLSFIPLAGLDGMPATWNNTVANQIHQSSKWSWG